MSKEVEDYRPSHNSVLFGTIQEAEQHYLGYILTLGVIKNDCLNSADEDIFYTETHRIIFNAIKEVHQEGLNINIAAVAEKLRIVQKPDKEPWVSYLTYLVHIAYPVPNLALKEIKRSAKYRKIGEDAYKIYQACKQQRDDIIDEKLNKLKEYQQIDSDDSNTLKTISAKDLINIDKPKSLWWELLYPGLISQVNSEPGVGKTTLAYNIACHGALNNPFLGVHYSKKIKTLYIDLETPTWLCKQKIESICNNRPEDFHLLNSISLKKDIEKLINTCKRGNFDLVIIDTQSRALDLEDENSNSESNRAAGLLRRLTKETSVAIMLMHHTKKADFGREVYRGRGASAISGAVDIVANLESVDAYTLKLNIAKNRASPNQSISMKKLGDDKFDFLGSDLNIEIKLIQKAIIELSAQQDSVNQKSIIKHLRGRIGEKRIIDILKQGVGKFWNKIPGRKNESLFVSIEGQYSEFEQSEFQNGKTATTNKIDFAVLKDEFN